MSPAAELAEVETLVAALAESGRALSPGDVSFSLRAIWVRVNGARGSVEEMEAAELCRARRPGRDSLPRSPRRGGQP